jgi:hypothetical protein
MLDRQRGKIIFECNVCGQSLEPDTADFNEAKRTLDDNGWRARKIGSDWLHGCDKCGDPAAERAISSRSARSLL